MIHILSAMPEENLPFPPTQPNDSLAKLAVKTLLWTAFFLIILLFFSAVGLGLFAWQKANTFSQNAGVSIPNLIQVAKIGWKTQPQQIDDRVNFLVLGTDNLANRGHAVSLTDTMLVASINLKTGAIHLYSIPRDLWIPDYKTKTNPLYTYEQYKYPHHP